MGLYDRDYTQYDYDGGYRPQTRLFTPRLSPVVKWVIIINLVVFVSCYLSDRLANVVYRYFSVFPVTFGSTLQVWRLVTYQFLHSLDRFDHILWNMVGLVFFGPMLEQKWGSKKFLTFYLICGATGGILYPFFVMIGWLPALPLVGASGAILGILAALAILQPNSIVYAFAVFPMKLVVIVIVYAGISILTLLRPERSPNAGGEAAHLAGMVAGAVYVLSQSRGSQLWLRVKHRFGRKREISHQNLQVELDNILDKVNRSGIHSLTRRERRVLKQATELERKRNRL